MADPGSSTPPAKVSPDTLDPTLACLAISPPTMAPSSPRQQCAEAPAAAQRAESNICGRDSAQRQRAAASAVAAYVEEANEQQRTGDAVAVPTPPPGTKTEAFLAAGYPGKIPDEVFMLEQEDCRDMYRR